MKISKICVSILLLISLSLQLISCGTVRAVDLMDGVRAESVAGKAADAAFITAQLDFAASLFRHVADEENGENLLISPLSVMAALAMTANGADGETLSEMEKALGGISVEALNEYLSRYIKNLPSDKDYKLHVANSIWTKKGELSVKKSFLEKNNIYYDAAIYERPFNDDTVREVNAWVSEHTDGMIDHLLNEINPNLLLMLINAVCFDAAWATPYAESDEHDRDFTNADGSVVSVDMMYSRETRYLFDKNTTGFIKDYVDGKYQFVALLPDEGMAIEDYISSLTAKKIENLLASEKTHTVRAGLPKFEYDFEISLPEILMDMGMEDAFLPSRADFAGISETPVFIGDVLHKTFISVKEDRTKAAAVTGVLAYGTSAQTKPIELKEIILDRPFVYMIVDGKTKLPVFIGTVTNID